jgi:hypothetical protein
VLEKGFHLQKKKSFARMGHDITGIAPANKTQGVNYELRITAHGKIMNDDQESSRF